MKKETPWRELAACAGRSQAQQNWFFAGALEEEKDLRVMEEHDKARMICYAECPVQTECLRFCMETDSLYGIWGGLTPSQRKRHTDKLKKDGLEDVILQAIIERAGRRIINRLKRLSEFGGS